MHETYTQVYFDNAGTTLRAGGKGADFTFPFAPSDSRRYRLFTVGETEQFYFWKNEPDGQFLYRTLSDALDTRHAIRDRYCLDLSSKRPEAYLRRVYKKIAWPPVLSYLRMANLPESWTLGVTVTAEDLAFSEGGYLQMRLDVRRRHEGVDPRLVGGDPDARIVLPIPAGTYTGKALSVTVEIPKDTAHVGVFLEGKGYCGKCFAEQPRLAADGENLLPAFNESVADREKLDWVAQFLSRKEWPEFRVTLNGTVLYEGEIFERVHRRSEWELPLPKELLKAENTLTYELLSDYHDPLPYTISEIGVIDEADDDVTVLAVSEAAPAGGKARVLVRTAKDDLTVRFESASPNLSGDETYHFAKAGLHGILLSCGDPSENASFTLRTDGCTAYGTVKRIVLRADDGIVTGTGDLIYVPQSPREVEDYLAWYFSNHVGNLVTIRPAYRWSGTRVLNPDVIRDLCRVLNELDVRYSLMADGREIPGLSAQPDPELLAGKGFLGWQMHERDGAQYYWGIEEIKSHTTEMVYDLFRFAYEEDPDHTGTQYGPSHVRAINGNLYRYANRVGIPRDYRLAHERSVESLRAMRRDRDTRHTGPSCAFKYMKEAGFSWLGAETMYGTMEPLMGFLRGVARECGMPAYGVHHAVQWSSSPHESPARYRRYRLALYSSYILGATEINTEEGLWRLEEYYKYHHRFTPACRAHGKEQRDFYRYLSTHSRTGRYASPAAILHGRDDGIVFFGRNNAWGIKEPQGCAEDSWDLITALYPKAKPGSAVYRHGCPEDEAQGYHSGSPYGNPDVIPAEGDATRWGDYRALVFLGYHRFAEEDADRFLSYVRAGGTLLLTRAHLTGTTEMDAVKRGDLTFADTAAPFMDGTPRFRTATYGGVSLSVCENPASGGEVLLRTDDGAPLLLRYKVGNGEVLLYNTKEYPAHPAIRAAYESTLTSVLKAAGEAEPVYAEAGDDVSFTVWEQEDGTRHLYFLAVDWYRDPSNPRSAVLRLGDVRYTVTVPFGVLLKCVTDGKTAAFAESEDGEVLSVTETALTVQGTGTVPFTVARKGETKTVTVDFSQAPVQTLPLDV